MYFASRMQAGRMLASQIAHKYADEDCAVVALSDGGAVVGAQIAMRLECVLGMLLTGEIELPRETTAIAGISQDGSFSYNHAYSSGEIDEFVSEYRGIIEQQKLERLHDMNHLSGKDALIKRDLLARRHVILVSDGMPSGFAVDLAMQYLKPVPLKSLIIAVPFAGVNAVDRMHVLADDIFCLNVLEDYISTDHYYDNNDVPEHEVIIEAIQGTIKAWEKTQPEENQ